MSEKKTPSIRFKGFSDDWEQRKLGDIVTQKMTNGVMNHPGKSSMNVKHINVINMYTDDAIHTNELESSSYNEAVVKKCNVEIGDIFLTRSSLKPEGIAEANVLLDAGAYVFDDHLIRIKLRNEYYPLFVKELLGTKFIKNQFIERSKTTAFTTIGQEDISASYGAFPTLNEQKRIASLFAQIQTIITLHQCKIKKLQILKKSMLENMFPKNDEKTLRIRFQGFTTDWEQRKLFALAEVKDSARIPNILWSNKGVPYIRASDLTNNNLSGTLFLKHSVFEFYKSQTGAPEKGDVLFNGGGEIGKTVLKADNSDMYVQGGAVLYVKTSKSQELNGKYLTVFFQSPLAKKYIEMAQAGGTMKHFTLLPAQQMPIIYPSQKEQQKIGVLFLKLDNLIALHQRKLEKLQKIKKSMLEKMFV